LSDRDQEDPTDAEAVGETTNADDGHPIESARQWVEERLASFLLQPLLLVVLASLAFVTWRLRKELVILFAAIFFGISLYKGARWLTHRTGMAHGLSVSIWFVASLTLLASFFVFAGQRLDDQYGQLGERIPAALEELESRVEGVPILGSLTDELNDLRSSMSGDGQEGGEGSGGGVEQEDEESGEEAEDGGSSTMHFVQITLTTLSHVGLIILLAFYIAYDGKRYQGAFIVLIPPEHRDVGRDLVAAVGHALPWWLVGRLASMAVVAALTAPGLYLLGIPLAMVLGLIAGIFSFVPVLGPLASVIPAALVTLESEPSMIVWVLALYGGVQILESWFLTPRIQDHVSETPPFLLLSAQLGLGVLVGIWGVMFSTPVALTTLVVIQVLWLRYALGEELETPGSEMG